MNISDNGPPIPEIEIDILDDEEAASNTYHGSGLGLWVTKWCVESLGGRLEFEQEDPRGNSVTLSEPKAASPTDEE